MPTKFGRRPFPRLSVILFTEWQNEWPNDHITSALLADVTTDIEWSVSFSDSYIFSDTDHRAASLQNKLLQQ